ncbi:single-stranded-DNA-specific exonuclease RecJ [Candidatus Formimonas warabiya]|uniref:Single-stranded-DNA-specific exonuclease RecJ n=1 Tax=Formimonas warabiya TaxID=1761012 RepID=A0A3G1KNC1_FORW1|nr:single-stranded-DNA-specific exonuclease RecJ [Candidatus Formimonas warabiya]ATW23963.1 single-stranded-DNA-specific exonuclease RecJ [Candidatus Formimonas warabiya]
MPPSRKRWILAPYDCQLQFEISQKVKISPLLAQICINRGITSPEDVENFFHVNPSQLHSSFSFNKMEQAVTCMEEAIANQEKILIYGDYDVDGVTGTSLLYLYLKSRQARVSYYIPDRKEEGYGLNEEAVYWASREKFSLIVTVDCGISSVRETELANSLGLKIIITDHHQPPEILPAALAIINPKVKASKYPFPHLAGVGVAWKLAQGLEMHREKKENHEDAILKEFLDLVCLGTIADVVPLTGENRVIVALGLKKMMEGQRPGIQALLSVTGLDNKPVTAGQVGFILAPRLNAAGRLSSARLAVELLTSSLASESLERALVLDKENTLRQAVEGEIFQQALHMIDETVDLEEDYVIVLAAPEWHAGVIGIAASRLVEKYHRPVVLIAIEGELAKGSARSIECFDIFLALRSCQEWLVQFGGHRLAAGIKLKEENIAAFRKAINTFARTVLSKDHLIPVVKIDLELDLNTNEQYYINDIERLAPFGAGNPLPVLAFRNLKIVEAKGVGVGAPHLKVKFESGGHFLDGIGFNLSHHLSWITIGSKVDVAVTLERNLWNGCEKIQFVLKDIQPHPVLISLSPAPDFDQEKGMVIPGIRADKEENEDHPAFSALINRRTPRVSMALPLKEGRFLWYHAAAYNCRVGKSKTIILFSCPSQLGSEYALAALHLGKLGISVGWADSRMAQEEKDQVWDAFTKGWIRVLFTTPEYLEAQDHDGSERADALIVVAIVDPFDSLLSGGEFMERCHEILRPGLTKGLVITTVSEKKNHLSLLEKTFNCPDTYSDIKQARTSLVDGRGMRNREEYLLDLLQKEESCLVYLSLPSHVEELMSGMSRLGIRPESMTGCYGDQMPWQHQMVMKKIQKKVLRTVVTTRHLYGETDGLFDHVIFYHSPRNMFDFFRFAGCGNGEKGAQIHLLYNTHDVAAINDVLQADFPDRDLLGKIYKGIKALSPYGRQVSGTKEEILQRLKIDQDPCRKERAFDAWLSTMSELGLLKVSRQGNRFCLEFINNGNKCRLEDSFRYREGLREKKAFDFWHHIALSPQLDQEIFDLLG